MNLIAVFLTLSTLILGINGVLHGRRNKGIFDYASSFIPKVTDYFSKSSIGSIHHHKKNHPKDEHHDDHDDHHYYVPHKEEVPHKHHNRHKEPYPHHHHKDQHHVHKDEYYPHHNGLHDFGYYGHDIPHVPLYGGHFHDYSGYYGTPHHFDGLSSYGGFDGLHHY